MKKVSIIIPVYNVEKYLERCLDSVINQDYPNIEIILINDGSTDGSELTCERYASKYNVIKYYNKENTGIAQTRNFGIKKSTGDYVTFLDSDDWVKQNIYSRVLEVAEENNSDIVEFGFTRYINEENKIDIINYKEITNISGVEAIKENFIGNIPTVFWSKFFRRELFLQNSIECPDIKCFEDQMPNIKLYYNAKRVTILNESLMYYFYREGSLTANKFSDTNLLALKELNTMKKFLKEKEIWNLLKEPYQKKYFNMVFGFVISRLIQLNLKDAYSVYFNYIREDFNNNTVNYVENIHFTTKDKIKIFLITHMFTLILPMVLLAKKWRKKR